MCAVCIRYSWSVVSCTVLETLPLQAADCAMCSQDRDRVVLERDAALQRVAVIAVDRDGVREERDALSQQVTDLDAQLQSAGAERDAALQREVVLTVDGDRMREERDSLSQQLQSAATERDAALQRVADIAVDRDAVQAERDALSQQVTDLEARLQSAGAETSICFVCVAASVFSLTVMSQARPITRSHKWSLTVFATLITPIVAAVLYFGAIYLMGVDPYTTIAVNAKVPFTVESRMVRRCAVLRL